MLAHAQDLPEPEPLCGIFQMYPQSGQDVTILDARRAPSASARPAPQRSDQMCALLTVHGARRARDALETCGLLVGPGRDSCFAQFGCSAERTTKYFTAVQALESAYEREGASRALLCCSSSNLRTCSCADGTCARWRRADEGDDDEYVPDKPGDSTLPNPLGFVWRS